MRHDHEESPNACHSASLINVYFRLPVPETAPRLFKEDETRLAVAKEFRAVDDNVLSRAHTTHNVPVDYRNNGSFVSASGQLCLVFNVYSNGHERV